MTRLVISRDVFLNTQNLMPREDVPIPEFGEGAVIPVHGMTAGDRSKYEKGFMSKGGKTNDEKLIEFRQRLVVACCRDDDGKQIFTEADVVAVGKKSATLMERIVDACQRLSGMSKQDIEETIKNSVETPAE